MIFTRVQETRFQLQRVLGFPSSDIRRSFGTWVGAVMVKVTHGSRMRPPRVNKTELITIIQILLSQSIDLFTIPHRGLKTLHQTRPEAMHEPPNACTRRSLEFFSSAWAFMCASTPSPNHSAKSAATCPAGEPELTAAILGCRVPPTRLRLQKAFLFAVAV